uniref:T-box domain-containing protein n=1 Tax=Rhabditophanes sp. KR3021 TaxID=114890 RepID=A0AC35TM22_9BILA
MAKRSNEASELSNNGDKACGSMKRSKFSIDHILEKKICTKDDDVITDKAVDDDCPDNLMSSILAPGTSPNLDKVQCKLEGKELWGKFFHLNTEMIITKSGRRMFPTLKIKFDGCQADAQYYIFLDIVPVDDRRYRYVYNKSSWLTAGKAEPSPPSRIYLHPDSPISGKQLLTQVISFEKVKLTNSTDYDKPGHLVLNSMHKYQPRVHLMLKDNGKKISALNLNSSSFDLSVHSYRTFKFLECQFMAVTAYQNQLITQLKIEKNPFAKGFRDPTGRNTDYDDQMSSSMMAPQMNFTNIWPQFQQPLDSIWFARLNNALFNNQKLNAPLPQNFLFPLTNLGPNFLGPFEVPKSLPSQSSSMTPRNNNPTESPKL